MAEEQGGTVWLDVPREVVRIARRLGEAGYEVWAVGGAVRDALSGRRPGDWDLTTSARPGDVRRIFRRTAPIGIEHGTVGVVGKDGQMYEVTTFRRDVETFGRRARVVFSDRLEEDLERRDFTINAVAWQPLTGEVRDPHGGMSDLRAGVLRTVGDPAERFREDRLRVLRALRFAGRFDLRVEDATWRAVRQSAGQLGALSAERVREELYKVLGGQASASRSLALYAASGVLAHLYPELQACVGAAGGKGKEDVWTHLLHTVDAVPRTRMVLRCAALLHDVGRPAANADAAGAGAPASADHAAVGAALARELLRRLKASNADIDRVVHLVAQHTSLPAPEAPDAEVRRWLRRVGTEHVNDLFRLRFAAWCARHPGAPPEALLHTWRRVRNTLAARPALHVGDLAIGGAELREMGVPPGPRFGEILRELLERVTEEPALNTRERLLAQARTMEEEG